jgi:hypothetical protein
MVINLVIALHVVVGLAVGLRWFLQRSRNQRPPCGDCGFVMTGRHTHAMFCPCCGRVRGRPGLVLPERRHTDPIHHSVGVMLMLPFVLFSAVGAAMLVIVLRLWE